MLLPLTAARSSIFLSTPSARRATEHQTALQVLNQFLSTPSARRATTQEQVFLTRSKISIHALREEGDAAASAKTAAEAKISIHALREEGDA